MKCALVTGGSRGIGRAICLKMSAMGYYVLVNYKGNEEEANKTLEQIRAVRQKRRRLGQERFRQLSLRILGVGDLVKTAPRAMAACDARALPP